MTKDRYLVNNNSNEGVVNLHEGGEAAIVDKNDDDNDVNDDANYDDDELNDSDNESYSNNSSSVCSSSISRFSQRSSVGAASSASNSSLDRPVVRRRDVIRPIMNITTPTATPVVSVATMKEETDNVTSTNNNNSNSSSSHSSTTSSVEGITFSNSQRRNDIIARTEAISKSINAQDFDELLRSNSSGRRFVNGNNNTPNSNNNISSSSNSNNSSNNKQFSVLIVEDTDICAKFLTMQLTRMDCKTYRAENGRVAIDILKDYIISSSSTASQDDDNILVPVVPYDMILMDLSMPIMYGLEATRLIRSELKLYDLPIVALTREMIDGCKEECKDVGFMIISKNL